MSDKLKTLSQAIRLGATFRPQCRGTLLDSHGRTCALGAAVEAIKGDVSESHLGESALAERFGLAMRGQERCPVCDEKPVAGSICDVVAHLNDDHEWTREAIADWLEGRGL